MKTIAELEAALIGRGENIVSISVGHNYPHMGPAPFYASGARGGHFIKHVRGETLSEALTNLLTEESAPVPAPDDSVDGLLV